MQQVHLPETLSLSELPGGGPIGDTGVTIEDMETLIKAGVVTFHPNVVSGACVFAGTRVPLYNLWDYLAAGDTLETFLESFPTVPRDLAVKAMTLVGDRFRRAAATS